MNRARYEVHYKHLNHGDTIEFKSFDKSEAIDWAKEAWRIRDELYAKDSNLEVTGVYLTETKTKMIRKYSRGE